MSTFNLKRYWAAVKEARASIAEDWPYLTSIEDDMTGAVGGVVCQASRQDAGELLVKRTHRLATEAEVAAYKEDEAQRRKEILEAERQRRMLVLLEPEVGRQQPGKKVEK